MSRPEAVEDVYRQEYGRILAALIRSCGGDFELAEDSLGDAFETAVATWGARGVPDNPAAWLTTTARRRAIDRLRRRTTLQRKLPLLTRLEVEEMPMDDVSIPDERLRLFFTCCHPALGRKAQVALTLRTLGGLDTPAIASAFLVPEPTMAQRLVRAKRKIKSAAIPYRVPEEAELTERLTSVLAVVYLVFNEGYRVTSGPGLIRIDLSVEAIRLGRVLVALMPDEPEVLGLLALMLLHDARRPARVDAADEPVLLEDQDRSQWDAALIAEGRSLLDKSLSGGPAGPYAIQAAISALHSEAGTSEETDWPQIVALYGELLRIQPSPVIELNRAAAVAMWRGPEHGLELMAHLDADLGRYHLLHTARADLLRRLGRAPEAAAAYRVALDLVGNESEARFIKRRLAELEA